MSYSPSSPSPPATPPTSDSEDSSYEPSHIGSERKYARFLHPSPHPFAASTKADRAPPAYEKKSTIPCHANFTSYNPRLPHDGAKYEATIPTIQRSPSLVEDEQKRWDTAISSAVDGSQTKLDLSSANLTYIPSSIIDLNNLVVLTKNKPSNTIISQRPFIRSTTAPALLLSPRSTGPRPFLPSQTTNRLAFGLPKHKFNISTKEAPVRDRCEVELYLMRNAIRTLPRELFELDRLVVLSLRQNKLTSIPPAIGQLNRLRELNIANNRLTYLPAQIQSLYLTSLQLHPNPFIPSPQQTGEQPTQAQMHTHKVTPIRTLGPLKRGQHVPTLSEFVLRHLLTPISCASCKSSAQWETRLESAMTLAQIDKLTLPVHIRRVIRASTGHGKIRVDENGACLDTELDMSSQVCPCPRHRRMAEGNKGPRKGVRFQSENFMSEEGMFDQKVPVFCGPVEERMEWVGVVAGVQVAESPGAWVPILWQGCGLGCLGFLNDVSEARDEPEPLFKADRNEDDEEFEFSEEE